MRGSGILEAGPDQPQGHDNKAGAKNAQCEVDYSPSNLREVQPHAPAHMYLHGPVPLKWKAAPNRADSQVEIGPIPITWGQAA